MAKKKKNAPVYLGNGLTFGEVLDQIEKQPVEPMTPEEQKKLDGLLAELAKTQGPGDAFMFLQITNKKTKP